MSVIAMDSSPATKRRDQNDNDLSVFLQKDIIKSF
jgi:hypothetical protein